MPKAGTAYIRIEGDFTPFHRQLAKEGRNLSRRIDIKADTRGIRNLNSTLGDTTKRIHVAEKGMRRFDVSATSVNTHMAFMRNLFRVVKWPSIAAGFGLVAEGAAAAGAGVISLTSALAPLTGLLATVPTGLAALAQGLGTVQLATFGVGDALGLLEKQHQDSATAAANNADTQKQSAETIRNAEEALADAHRAEREAQDDLTDAHEDAREALIDLRFAGEEAILSEKRAALELKRARNEEARLIKDQSSTAYERRSAALDVAEAELALREARQANKDTAEELNESERKGIEQSEQVVDARKALADAERATASAARVLKAANQDAKDALEGTDSAADNLRKQFASMTPEAREFAKFLYGLRPQLQELRSTAAKGLLPGVEDGITAAMKNFPELKNVIDATAKSFGRIAKESGEYFGREGVGRDIEALGLKNAKRFEILADAGFDFGDALRHVTMASQPLVDFLTESTADFAEWTKEEAKAGRESGRLAHFFRQTRDVTADLIDMGGDLAHILSRIGEAAAPTGRNLLDDLNESVEDLRDWTDTEGGKNALRTYFEDSQPAIEEMGALVADLVKGFFSLTQDPNLAPFIKKVRTELLPVLLEITKLLTATLGPELIDLFVQLAHVMREIGTPALVTFVKFTTEALHLVNQVFTSIPGLAQSAAVALGGFSIVKLLGLQRAAGLAAGFGVTFAQALGVEVTRGSASIGFKNAGAAMSERFAGGAKYAMGAAFAGIGFANIIKDVVEGDWGEVAAEAGGMIAGAIAGGLAGGLPGAMLGAGIGSLIGGALNDLFSADDLPEVKKIPYIQELRNQFRDLAKDAQRAAQNAHGAINNYVRTSEKIRDARRQEKRSSQEVNEAERRLDRARQNYSDNSKQVVSAERALKRAREGQEEITRKLNRLERVYGDQKDAAKGAAQRAIRIGGVEIRQAKQLVSEYRRRLHAMSESERRSEEGEKLSRRLSNAQSDLAGAVRRANKVIEDAGDEIGGHFAKNLNKTLQDITKFRKSTSKWDEGGGLVGYLEAASKLVPKNKKPMEDIGKLSEDVREKIDNLDYKGSKDFNHLMDQLKSGGQRGREAQGDLVNKTEETESALGQAYGKAGAHVEDFDKTTYWGLFNILSNFAKALKVVDVKAPTGFDLSKPKGKDNKAQGGMVKGGVVPGTAPGDRHVLSLNGQPIANVESGELISVTNRDATAYQMALNKEIPRGALPGFAEGGLAFALGPYTIPPIEYDDAHAGGNAHVHISGQPDSWVVAIGRQLQDMGFLVGENPSFGGIQGNHGHYGPTDHWHGGAIDVNSAANLVETRAEVAAIARLLRGEGAISPGVAQKIVKYVMGGPDGPMKDMGQAILDEVHAEATNYLKKKSSVAADPGVGGNIGPVPGNVSGAGLMRSIARDEGWSFDDWWEVDRRETGHGVNLINPQSTARMRGQFLDINWGKYGPGSEPRPHINDPSTWASMDQQIISMASYIKERYGNSSGALAHHNANNWYKLGGIVAQLQEGGAFRPIAGAGANAPGPGAGIYEGGIMTGGPMPFTLPNVVSLLRRARGQEERSGVIEWASTQFKNMSGTGFLDEDGDLAGTLAYLRGQADLMEENAGFADALSRSVSFVIPEGADDTKDLATLLSGITIPENPFTGEPLSWADLLWGIGEQELSPGDDVDVDVMGMFQGLDQGEWIVKQLEALFNLRNNLIVDQGALSHVRAAVKDMVQTLNGEVLRDLMNRIHALKEELNDLERKQKQADKDFENERDKIQDKLDKRAKETKKLQEDLADEKAKPKKKQSQSKINKIETELAKNSIEVNALHQASDKNQKDYRNKTERLTAAHKDVSEKLTREQKVKETMTDAILPMLTDRQEVLDAGDETLIEELRAVQGSGVTQDVLPYLPELGVLKGEIGDAQLDLFNLGRGQPTIAAQDIDTPDLMHIQDLIEFANAIQHGAFRTEPYASQFAGFFAGGGVIPRGQFGVAGETGLPEIIEGPARVYAPGQVPGGAPIVLEVIVEDGAVDPDKIRVVAGHEFDVRIKRKKREDHESWLAGDR